MLRHSGKSKGITLIMGTREKIFTIVFGLFLFLGYAIGYNKANKASSAKCIKLVDEAIKEVKSGH